MTKAEYNARLLAIQGELLERSKAEDIRHNSEIGRLRSQFRAALAQLRTDFEKGADPADIRALSSRAG